MKVAIVGAGVSGLVAAHLLHRDHEITVYEAGDYAGGHTNTVAVEDDQGQTHQVDTGFIVFNDRNYPNFQRLLSDLGVGWQRSNMSFGVSDGLGDFEYCGGSPNGLFANRRHIVTPRFHRMVADLLRFNREARALLEQHARGDNRNRPAGNGSRNGNSNGNGNGNGNGKLNGFDASGAHGADNRLAGDTSTTPNGPDARNDTGPSLGDWLAEMAFSDTFVERLIVPQAAAVWSADPQQLWSFPAAFMLEFFDNHGMLGFRDRPRWQTVAGGSARYVEALTKPWRDRLRLGTPVESVQRAGDHVLLTARGQPPERYDEVVIATHSDQALRALADPSDAEREILGAIPYMRNEAVLHTDVRMLPQRRRAWASWNYHLLDEPRNVPTVTYHMNRLQALQASDEFCVTLNRGDEIDPATVRGSFSYAHPVYTAGAMRAQRRWDEISGQRRTHYCGAYWGWGFHEDGVLSALRVGRQFGAQL